MPENAKTFEEYMMYVFGDLWNDMGDAEQDSYRKVWNAAVEALCEIVKARCLAIHCNGAGSDDSPQVCPFCGKEIAAMQAAASAVE